MATVQVNVDLMNKLVTEMVSVRKNLGQDAGILRGIMDSAMLSQDHPPAVARVATWCDTQIPSLRRRAALAVKAAEALPGPLKPGTVVPVDESLISTKSPGQAKADADAAAAALKKNLDALSGNANAELDDAIIKALQAGQDDPYFAAELARQLPPKYLAGLAGLLRGQRDSFETRQGVADFEQARADLLRSQQALVNALGANLGLASRQVGDLALPPTYVQQWKDQLLIRPGAFTLSMLMQHGNFGGSFVPDMAKAIYDTERKAQKNFMWAGLAGDEPHTALPLLDPWGKHDAYDPLATVLNELGRNPTGAQQFLTKDRLDYLIQHRWWPADHANGFGNAVEAATTYFRGHDALGKRSAEIAGQVVADFGQVNKSDLLESNDPEHRFAARLGGPMAGMRDSMGRMLASYISDVDRSLAGTNQDPRHDGPWAHLPVNTGDPYGADFGAASLIFVLHHTMGDDGAYRSLVAAQTAQMQVDVNRAATAATGSVEHRLGEVRSAAEHAATAFGFLVQARSTALGEDASARDARNVALIDLARNGFGLIPIPNPLAAGVTGIVVDGIAGALQTDHLSDAQHQAADQVSAVRILLNDTVATAMTNHGMYYPDQSPQSWLADPRRSAQIRQHPFLRNGRLLTPAEFAHDPAAADAYSEWLFDPHGGGAAVGSVVGETQDKFNTASDYSKSTMNREK